MPKRIQNKRFGHPKDFVKSRRVNGKCLLIFITNVKVSDVFLFVLLPLTPKLVAKPLFFFIKNVRVCGGEDQREWISTFFLISCVLVFLDKILILSLYLSLSKKKYQKLCFWYLCLREQVKKGNYRLRILFKKVSNLCKYHKKITKIHNFWPFLKLK